MGLSKREQEMVEPSEADRLRVEVEALRKSEAALQEQIRAALHDCLACPLRGKAALREEEPA